MKTLLLILTTLSPLIAAATCTQEILIVERGTPYYTGYWECPSYWCGQESYTYFIFDDATGNYETQIVSNHSKEQAACEAIEWMENN